MVARADSFTVFVLAIMLGCCIFLQRFAVPLGASQIPATFVACYGLFVLLLISGRLAIQVKLLTLFLLTVAGMTVSLLVSAETASMASFAYVIGIYVLYIFRLKNTEGLSGRVLDIFGNLMAICAACGIAQFLVQFVVGPDLAFPLDNFVPDRLLLDGYNVIIPLEFESSVMKSNGVFFLEPSFFSQFLALAAIIEFIRRQRAARLLLYAVAMVVCYSGTGILLVAVLLPSILARGKNTGILLALAGLACILAMAGGAVDISALTDRIGEFSSTESSGFARFISPYFMIRDFLIDSPVSIFFGLGPGAIVRIENEASTHAYLAHDATWIKLLLEYGLVAAVLFITFITMAFFTGSQRRTLSWAILLLYLFLGGYLLNGCMHFLFVAILAWHNKSAEFVRQPLRRRRFLQVYPGRAMERALKGG
jgi:hypothetical protein